MDRERGHLIQDYRQASASLIWVKAVGLGNTSVGKTCLIKHFCESKFSSGYQATVGVDYGFKIQNVHGLDVRVHLWDLSGNSDYADVRNELYGGTDMVFLVYDITNAASFDAIGNWVQEVQKFGPSPKPLIAVVGNKSDMKGKRAISHTDAKKWASSQNYKYYETSCVSGEGIDEMFTDVIAAVVKKRNIQLPQDNTSRGHS